MTKLFQKVIDVFRGKYQNKRDFITAAMKYWGLNKNISTIKTLVLGSSHGQYSYIPDDSEYNIALPSQDLYYNYKIYEKYADKMKNLEEIVLFYSVFSKGFEVEKTSARFICLYYAFLFNIFPKTVKASIFVLIEYIFRFFQLLLFKYQANFAVEKSYNGAPIDLTEKHIPEIPVGGG